jgi:DNA-binding CsgD family transcriptional regulator
MLAELVDRIDRHCDAPVLDAVVDVLPTLLDAELAVAYRVGVEHRRRLYLDLFHQRGAPKTFHQTYQRFVARASEKSTSPAYDVLHPEPLQRNVAVVASKLISPKDWENAPVTLQVFQPLGLHRHAHVRVRVCDGSLLLSWVGVLGLGRYGARELALLNGIVAPLASRLRFEARLAEGARDAAAIVALLETIPVPAFLVREGRVIVHASTVGKSLLDAGVVDPVASIARSREHDDPWVQIRPLVLPGLPEHVLVVHEPAHDELDARLAHASRRWRLTPAQTGVLRRLARGEANKTIAEHLGCAVVTVEVHVTALLKRATASSRAELVAKFWTLR